MKKIILSIKDSDATNLSPPEIDFSEESQNMVQDIVIAIQQERIAAHITQNELARRIGVSHTTIMRIENLSVSPTISVLFKMILALNFQMSIVDDEESNQETSISTAFSAKSQKDIAPEIKELPIHKIFNLDDFRNGAYGQNSEIVNQLSVHSEDKDSHSSMRSLTFLAPDDSQLIRWITSKGHEKNEHKNQLIAYYQHSISQHNKDLQQNAFCVFLLNVWDYLQDYPSEKDYFDYLKQFTDYYYGLGETFGFWQDRIHYSRKITNQLLLSIKEYSDGQHSIAYKLFCEALRKLPIDLLYSTLESGQVMYRARYKTDNHSFSKDDFYHVPFELRTRISSQRYSYPGLPCLYVGSSPDICFKELGCTYYDAECAEIKVQPNKSCIVFDLTKLFDKVPWNLSDNEKQNFLDLFPLVFLCSTTLGIGNLSCDFTGEKRISFRPDYIIPQLLLEYVIDNNTFSKTKVLGIQYFSAKTDYLHHWINGNERKLCDEKNIAFPARTINATGYCEFLKQYLYVGKILSSLKTQKKQKQYILFEEQTIPKNDKNYIPSCFTLEK